MRLVAPAGYHSCTASSDKSAKTAANNHMARRSRFENGGSSASTVNDADSGVSSQRSINELELIKQRSPSARNRLRAQLPRSPFPVRLDARAGYHGRTASAKKSAKTAAMARRSRSANGGSPASSLEGLVKKEKHIPLISQLPRSSFPVRLVARAGYHGRTASAKKSATTAANNHMARHSRSANGGSPASSKSRPMEMISPRGNEKKLELRDLRGSKEVTEIMSLKLTPLSKRMVRGSMGNTPYHHNRLSSRDTGSSEDNEGIEDESGEEKLHRDGVLSEKDESGVVGAGDEPAEGGGEGVDDLWGHGEAMAGDKDLPNSGQESDPGCTMTPRLRSVLLSSEMNNLFAELAAVSTPVEGYNNLEDENYPEDFQFSATRTSTSPNESPRQEKQEKKSGASPVSEGGVREEDPPIASVTSSSA